jgi:hypothetical protein
MEIMEVMAGTEAVVAEQCQVAVVEVVAPQFLDADFQILQDKMARMEVTVLQIPVETEEQELAQLNQWE